MLTSTEVNKEIMHILPFRQDFYLGYTELDSIRTLFSSNKFTLYVYFRSTGTESILMGPV